MKKVALFFAPLLAYAGLALAVVNVNTATKAELESLEGIGAVKAQAIVDHRKKNGNFKSLEEVKKVDGVGDATFEKIKKDISLSGATTIPAHEKAEKKVEAVKDKAVVAKDKVEKKVEAAADKVEKKVVVAKDKVEEKKAALDKKADDKKAEAKKIDKKDEQKK